MPLMISSYINKFLRMPGVYMIWLNLGGGGCTCGHRMLSKGPFVGLVLTDPPEEETEQRRVNWKSRRSQS